MTLDSLDNSFTSDKLNNQINNIRYVVNRQVFDRLFPQEKKNGFYMNQKIGNCYLIVSLNAIRLNSYFMEELYKKLLFTKEDNIFKSKVSYIFPDGQEVTIFLKDLKIQKKEIDILNFIKNSDIKDLINEILINIEKKGNLEILFKKGYIEYIIDSRGKKRLLFSNNFLNLIKKQIIDKNGEYFSLLSKIKKIPSVDAPLGYKILEALYTAKKGNSNNREAMIEGYSRDVLVDFLGHKEWKFDNYLFVNNLIPDIIVHILNDYIKNKNNYILIAVIKPFNFSLNFTPFFDYNGYKMADGHAYSIVGFDKENKQLHIVNPWDNNKILNFSLEDFFKIFTSLTIAKRKRAN